MDARRWAGEFAGQLQEEFGPRLLYVGLQGSRLRGEEGPESDIDVMAVLDALALPDLDRYRAVLARQPEAEKACGFICGRQELWDWPRHELFSLQQETEDQWGALAPLLAPLCRQDIVAGVQIGAANLYHEVCHRYLYSQPAGAEQLRGAYKAAVFVIKQQYYLRGGVYLRTRRELLPRLQGTEREIVLAVDRWAGQAADRAARPGRYFSLLLDWCAAVLHPQGRG